MTTETILQLPLAVSISGSEQVEIVQGGTSKQTTTAAIAGLAARAGTVTQINTNSPLSGGPITTTGTISLQSGGVTNQYLATMPSLTVKANITGGTAAPTDVTASQFISAFGVGTVTSVGSGAGLTGGPITTTGTLSLSLTGVSAGTYGSASTVGQFTVDAYGRITTAANQTIAISPSQVTGLGTMATQNANSVAITGGTINGTTIGGTTPAAATFTALTATGTTNLGTIASGTWNGTAIGVAYGGTGATTAAGARTNLGAAASGANSDITSLSGLTTPLSAPQGGTGFGSYTTGDILYADSSSTLARLNDVATGNALISGGVGVAPAWGKIGLTTHVSGTLPVANGGTGATSLTGYLIGNGTGAFTTQATIPNSGLTNSSVTIGSTTLALGGSTSTISGLTTLTLTQDPTSALQASTKQYVDGQVAAVSNTTYHTAVAYATTADLGTVTYSNGTGGVGATITNAGAQSALTIDGYTFTATDVTNATRVLVKNQTSGLQNGVYVVTNQGSGSTNWVLTRASDFNTVGTGPNFIETGAGVFITSGTTWGSTSWVMNTTGTITVGSTALVWVQTSSAGNFSVTAPITKTGNVIGLGTVGVANGGTGLTSLTQYQLLYAPTTASVGQIASGTSGYPLLSGGAGSAPSFSQLSLAGSGITGTLGVANGGTGTSTTFTQGSVVFAGASGIYSQSNTKLFWDNTNNRLGINTASPNTNLTIVSNTQTAAPPAAGSLPAGTDIYILGANASNTRITQDAYGTGNYAAYTGRQARGTAASPTASQTDDILVEVTGRGYGATAFSPNSVVRIDMEAAENFTDTAQGTYISLHTASLGTISAVERFRVGPSGQLGIGGATYGTSGYALVSGGASAAPSWSQISLTAGVTGTLPATNGGTGQSTYTIGDLLYASSSSALSKLAAVATGNVLLSAGVGTAPAWGQVNLASMVTGTLPVANGGTGQASALTQYGVVYGSTTSAMATTAAGTTGQILVANTGGAPTWSSSIPSGAGVTSFSAGTTGLTPSSATTGAVTLAGTLAVGNGGTGLTSYTTGDLLYASGTTTIAKLADVATGSVLVSGGVGTAPSYSATPTLTSLTAATIIGGTTASSTLTLKSTSGVGTSDAIQFQVGNNGATTAMYINTSGNVGIGTTSPGSILDVQSATSIIRNTATTGTNQVAIRQGNTGGYFYTGIDNSTGGYLTGANYAAFHWMSGAYPMIFATNNSERMRIDSSGNLSVGVASAGGYRTRLYGGNDNTLQIDNDGSRYTTTNIANNGTTKSSIYWDNTNTLLSVYATAASSQLLFGTANTERMRINSSGNVGIGETNPIAPLHITGNAPLTRYDISGVGTFSVGFNNSGSVSNNIPTGVSAVWMQQSYPLVFGTNGSERMRIDSSGNVNIATTGVSAKLYVNGNSASNIYALTDGVTITPDFSTGNNFSVTLGGNRTLANPTNMTVGQSGVIYVSQDATGSRTLSYGTYWKFPGGTAPTLTTTASATDALFYVVRTSTSITVNSALNIG